jgi:hypothetical protein
MNWLMSKLTECWPMWHALVAGLLAYALGYTRARGFYRARL